MSKRKHKHETRLNLIFNPNADLIPRTNIVGQECLDAGGNAVAFFTKDPERYSIYEYLMVSRHGVRVVPFGGKG